MCSIEWVPWQHLILQHIYSFLQKNKAGDSCMFNLRIFYVCLFHLGACMLCLSPTVACSYGHRNSLSSGGALCLVETMHFAETCWSREGSKALLEPKEQVCPVSLSPRKFVRLLLELMPGTTQEKKEFKHTQTQELKPSLGPWGLKCQFIVFNHRQKSKSRTVTTTERFLGSFEHLWKKPCYVEAIFA